jgi:hypothetical protein
MPNIIVPVHCAHRTGRFIMMGSSPRPEKGWMSQKNQRKGLISQTACDNVLIPKTSKVDSPSSEAGCSAKAGLLLAPREYAGGYNP